jgi:Protein of unknown function (DUF3592)
VGSAGETASFGAMAVLFAVLGTASARRLAAVTAALRHGVRAPGTCVRVRSRPHLRGDAVRHTFAFTAADGTRIEFEDPGRWSLAEGDPVTVTYDPRDPHRTATVAGRRSWSPVLQHLAVLAGCLLGTAGFAALLLAQLLGGS